jgi:hypothetical protein
VAIASHQQPLPQHANVTVCLGLNTTAYSAALLGRLELCDTNTTYACARVCRLNVRTHSDYSFVAPILLDVPACLGCLTSLTANLTCGQLDAVTNCTTLSCAASSWPFARAAAAVCDANCSTCDHTLRGSEPHARLELATTDAALTTSSVDTCALRSGTGVLACASTPAVGAFALAYFVPPPPTTTTVLVSTTTMMATSTTAMTTAFVNAKVKVTKSAVVDSNIIYVAVGVVACVLILVLGAVGFFAVHTRRSIRQYSRVSTRCVRVDVMSCGAEEADCNGSPPAIARLGRVDRDGDDRVAGHSRSDECAVRGRQLCVISVLPCARACMCA